jgi:hypothetical protein
MRIGLRREFAVDLARLERQGFLFALEFDRMSALAANRIDRAAGLAGWLVSLAGSGAGHGLPANPGTGVAPDSPAGAGQPADHNKYRTWGDGVRGTRPLFSA